jgi:hypothetical protein
MMYEVGEIYDIPVESIIVAQWNAPIRTKVIRSLVKSIEENGQQAPAMVTPQLQLIDGHRRLAALKELGIPTIRVIVCDIDQKSGYAIVNSEQRALGGREALWAYALGGPKSGTPTVLTQIERLERILGRPAMLRMVEKGFGPGIDRLSRWVLNACGKDLEDVALYRKVVTYIIDNVGASNYLRAWKDGNIMPKSSAVWAAIQAGVPLRPSSDKQKKVLRRR